MPWILVKYKENTNQKNIGSLAATFKHETMGEFIYIDERCDTITKSDEFVSCAKVALQEWIDAKNEYIEDENSILAKLNA